MSALFPQTVIALVWDFDKTLSPTYMQEPLFDHYQIDGPTFWQTANALPEAYQKAGCHKVGKDGVYLNHLLRCIRQGTLPNLSNNLLHQLGAEITFFPGLPAAFDRWRTFVTENDAWAQAGITVEHYVVSNGLREMILGSALAESLDGVWACELAPDPTAVDPRNAPLEEIAYLIDNTTKTRAIFEINKGSNTDSDIDVNDAIAYENRRIPLQHMIYCADGPSDIPVFSLVKGGGGRTYAVYASGDDTAFREARALQAQDRVHHFYAADYRADSPFDMEIRTAISEMADSIVARRENKKSEAVAKPLRKF